MSTMPWWEVVLMTGLWLAVLVAISHSLRKDARQPKPQYEDEDLP
jgi:hypothetical protein